jgi:CopA family copper-resistance protein
MSYTSHDSRRTPHSGVSRRDFLRSGVALGTAAGAHALLPGWLGARGLTPKTLDVLDGRAGPVDIFVRDATIEVDGRPRRAVTMNGTVPGPLLLLKEGAEAVIRVHNELDEPTSAHWHGIILPNAMDGVPGLNFPGIAPGGMYEYRFDVVQYGTYWYHSHSGFQEQLGHFAPMVIEPAGEEPDPVDREHVVILADWTFENPNRIFARLKKHPDYYNRQRRTISDFVADVREQGLGATVADRLDWGRMRMMASDIADITGATYTYLVNGMGPESNWTGLFAPGERVKLRIINGSAASFFDVRIPGLPMTVVQYDGQLVAPVETDEIRMGIGETFDVIVEPTGDRAYTLFAEAMDRSGFARGTLAPREGMEAEIPPRRERPLLTMADMGHGGHDMGHGGDAADEHAGHDMAGMAGAASDAAAAPDEHAGHDMGAGPMAVMEMGDPSLRAPGSLPEAEMHGDDEHGAGNAGVAMEAVSRLHEAGVGLGEDGWRVLRYTELRARERRSNFRAPDREIVMHLTGNMERYMWSIDGVHLRDAAPIELELGERIRLTMVNDTMMNHPMHLHGMWMEIENGQGEMIPRSHTVTVKPAEKLSVLFDADAEGPWAFHCHVMYHMKAGMFRIVNVRPPAMADGDHVHHGDGA